MGATNFIEFGKGKTAAEAFNRLVEEAKTEYSYSLYNGTISTTTLIPGSIRVADKWSDDVREEALKVANLDRYGKKWESRAIDCGRCDGGRMWAFYGWAAF